MRHFSQGSFSKEMHSPSLEQHPLEQEAFTPLPHLTLVSIYCQGKAFWIPLWLYDTIGLGKLYFAKWRVIKIQILLIRHLVKFNSPYYLKY